MTETTTLRCSCGQVELVLTGAPILTASCYCDDCQAGGRQLAALPGAISAVGPDGGTPSVLYRRDRVAWTKGAALLKRHKLRPNSPTNRVVASCCNTPMLVDFDRGPHWVAVYLGRFGDKAPPMAMLVNTRFKPAAVVLPPEIPAYSYFPVSFLAKLVVARIGMFLPS
jgi:hypothetical protein